jgi:chromosomal replication initiation ATPase DnaA
MQKGSPLTEKQKDLSTLILKIVYRAFKEKHDPINNKSKYHKHCDPKAFTVKLLREYTDLKYYQICDFLQIQNHSCLIAAKKKADNLATTSKKHRRLYNMIRVHILTATN